MVAGKLTDEASCSSSILLQSSQVTLAQITQWKNLLYLGAPPFPELRKFVLINLFSQKTIRYDGTLRTPNENLFEGFGGKRCCWVYAFGDCLHLVGKCRYCSHRSFGMCASVLAWVSFGASCYENRAARGGVFLYSQEIDLFLRGLPLLGQIVH
jgi:hypothetical protein